MAKKLSQMISHDDVNGREIKCLVIDNGQGNIYKEYNRESFPKLIEKYGDDVVRVFVPTSEQKDDLFSLIHNHIEERGGETHVVISDEDLFLSMFQQFTDLDVADIVEDKTLLRKVLDNPSELFLVVKSVLEQILVSIVGTYQDIVNTLATAPKEVVENITKKIELSKVSEEEVRKQKEIEELQARLKELQG